MINTQRVKARRRAVRLYLSNLQKVAYESLEDDACLVQDYTRGLRLDGTPHMRVYFGTTQVKVAKDTQRHAYLAAKKHIATHGRLVA